MDSIDLEVLKACDDWLTYGRKCVLVTVIQTWGASPRPPGAMLAICDDGRVVGSVSGGCIEDDLIERMHSHGIRRATPELVTYGVTAEEAHRFGLPCGGTVRLVVEPLSSRSRISELLHRISGQELVSRTLNLLSGEAHLAAGTPETKTWASETTLTTLHGPRWRLLIIGAGQVSRFLAQIAANYLVGLALAQARGTKYPDEVEREYRELEAMPELVQRVLATVGG